MRALKQWEELGEDMQELRTPVAPAKRGATESPRVHCAYNQTRECFLGLEVEVADLAFATLTERMQSLVLNSGEGLWVIPFRGVPTTGLPAPLDLIYLDDECRVIDIVESFPTFQLSPSRPRPYSVLVLPAHSIYSSQTQTGDQLLLCVAEEMEARLEGLNAGKSPIIVTSAVLLREEPLWSGGPGTVELETPDGDPHSAKDQRHQMNLVKPGSKNPRTPKNWLERWWSPDPRNAPREASPGLAAYYWNGAAPEAHGIRDISSTGLYVVTEERWYPGTLVLMTLQVTERGEEASERSIAVLSRAVRWGHDGVGLQFVLVDPVEARKGKFPVMDTADKREFDKFLQQLRKRR